MVDKPRILSLFPNFFNDKFNKTYASIYDTIFIILSGNYSYVNSICAKSCSMVILMLSYTFRVRRKCLEKYLSHDT